MLSLFWLVPSGNGIGDILVMKSIHDMRKLDLNLLLVFDALMRERSVTRAGHALGLTQSAMSHSLGRLRTFFDDPLFVKTHRGIAPTTKASLLGPAVLGVMETLRDQILSESSFDPKRTRRTFTLCMADLGEMVFLPPLVAAMKKEAPNCTLHTLQVHPAQLASTLGSGNADLALGSVRNASEGLLYQDLFNHTFVCIVSVKNREVKESLSLEQFSAMPHVAVTLTGRRNAPYDSALEDAGVRRTVKIYTPHFLTVPLLLDQHPEYIATVPRSLGSVFARHKIVRTVEPPIPLPTFSLRQFWHPRFHHDRTSLWLRAIVKRTFAELPASMR